MTILNDKTIRTAAISYKFNNNDTTNYGPIEGWDTSQVTNMEYLFFHFSYINADLSRWDTSQVTNMQGMFEGASNFNGDISQWDVSKVTYMKSMFSTATEFNRDLRQWDVSKVEDMQGMFKGAESFNSDVSKWNVSNVSFMHYMFYSAQSFNGDISQWDVTKVTNMDGMFYDSCSFDQELCWNILAASTIDIFEGSPGRLGQYPVCGYGYISTYTPTKTPSLRPRVTIPPTLTPTTLTPTDKHTSPPTLRPTMAPTPRPTNKPTALDIRNWNINYPVMQTTAPPTERHNKPPYYSPLGPFFITSFLSTRFQKLCMRPLDMSLTEGSRITIATCRPWNIFKWIIDDEGKFIAYNDPSKCIEMIGQRVSIEKCIDGLPSQRFIYNFNDRRILSIKNLLRGMAVVLDASESQGALVKSPKYISGKSTGAEIWEIMYNSDTTLSVPFPPTFMIVSHLSTDSDKWCLYPAYNAVVNGIKIAVSKCKKWNSYRWIMDSEGKILSVKSPNKCIERMRNRMIINDCEDGNEYQMWAYSVLGKKLASMNNGLLQVTVENGILFENAHLKLLRSESPRQPYQTWEIEKN